ncbi:MAG: hypothetical protein M1830_004224, partial [Pleopsidium flavum]
DDTSVAILEKASPSDSVDHGPTPAAVLHFHEKITADNTQHRGIHPVVSLESHQRSLAKLVVKALGHLPEASTTESGGTSEAIIMRNGLDRRKKRKPDIVSVTRGPGMRSSLSTGLDTAKGLAAAWQVPLLAINHMQAHALTSRLVSALRKDSSIPTDPAFPFLSLLVSGGHTLLVHSMALSEHKILASTSDIAIGDAIDKIARSVIPEDILEKSNEIMYGMLLEKLAFPNGALDHRYSAPATRGQEMARIQTKWGWELAAPFSGTRSGSKVNAMEFSFAGLGSAVKRIVDGSSHKFTIAERIDLAKEAMRLSFEHLASRVILALKTFVNQKSPEGKALDTLVVAGGVASNGYLRTILRSFLDTRGFSDVRVLFPPPSFCTDNAAMIAWTGIEMYEAGWETQLSCRPLRKWSIDSSAEDGGILNVSDWTRRR